MSNALNKQLSDIAQAIFDKKGFNILVLDVREVCTMTNYFIIAEGHVDRHVNALGVTVIDLLASQGLRPLHVEGQQAADWMVLDYGDFVIHLFIPELREKYALEELWHEGVVVDVEISIPKFNQESNKYMH
jgi:ribosome-associated protein